MWKLIVQHATPVESTFTLISLAAVAISIYALRDAHIDSSILAAAKVNGPRRAIADNNIHQEQLRFGISVVMVLASISFLFLEPPPPDYMTLPQSLVGLIAWCMVSGMVMVSSLIDKSIRKKLQQYAPLEVQTQSRVMPAPIREDGERSQTPQADVMKAALEARQEQKAEDAANGVEKPSVVTDLEEDR